MKSFYWQLQHDHDLEACMLPDIVEYNAIMNDIADDQHRRMIEEMDEEATFPLLWFFIVFMSVYIDLEDADAIANLIKEHMQYDTNSDYHFWEAILIRLKIAIRHSSDF